jgi:hypothetical protein
VRQSAVKLGPFADSSMDSPTPFPWHSRGRIGRVVHHKERRRAPAAGRIENAGCRLSLVIESAQDKPALCSYNLVA